MASSQSTPMEDVSQHIDFTSLGSLSSLFGGCTLWLHLCVCSSAVFTEVIFSTVISHTQGCTNVFFFFLMKTKQQDSEAFTKS